MNARNFIGCKNYILLAVNDKTKFEAVLQVKKSPKDINSRLEIIGTLLWLKPICSIELLNVQVSDTTKAE